MNGFEVSKSNILKNTFVLNTKNCEYMKTFASYLDVMNCKSFQKNVFKYEK